MQPKNSKHYILPTAEQLELDPQLVEDVVSFYYAQLRKALVDLKYHNIAVEELGTFKVAAGKLPKLIAKYTAHLSILNKESFRQCTIANDIETRRDKVIAVQKMINKEWERKKEKQNEKRTWYNMEKPETDS